MRRTWPGSQAVLQADVGVLGAQVHPLAAVLEMLVAHERAGQQVRLAKHLEAVADADHRLAGPGLSHDRLHHRREAGDGADAKVVAVGEAAGKDDRVVRGEVALAVPDEVSLVAHHITEGVLGVVVAPGAGKDDNSETHEPSVQGLPDSGQGRWTMIRASVDERTGQISCAPESPFSATVRDVAPRHVGPHQRLQSPTPGSRRRAPARRRARP